MVAIRPDAGLRRRYDDLRAQLSCPGWATLSVSHVSKEDDGRVIAQIAPSFTRRTRRRSTICLVAVAEETVDCHYCALSSVEILAAPSSITRCLSANLSAASLFENVATTRPFASPTLTSNRDPSWATMYVMAGINLHRSSVL